MAMDALLGLSMQCPADCKGLSVWVKPQILGSEPRCLSEWSSPLARRCRRTQEDAVTSYVLPWAW